MPGAEGEPHSKANACHPPLPHPQSSHTSDMSQVSCRSTVDVKLVPGRKALGRAGTFGARARQLCAEGA